MEAYIWNHSTQEIREKRSQVWRYIELNNIVTLTKKVKYSDQNKTNK